MTPCRFPGCTWGEPHLTEWHEDWPGVAWAPDVEPDPELDVVNHPPHYTSHPSGIECIQITEHMGFNLGNVVKYVWRADLKHDDAMEDLEKAKWYLEREIARRTR